MICQHVVVQIIDLPRNKEMWKNEGEWIIQWVKKHLAGRVRGGW